MAGASASNGSELSDAVTASGGSTADRLLVLAAELFREVGYGATTTRELSRRLGLQKASLYHHIDSKEDLLFDISIESLRRITAAVTAACEAAPPAARLEILIDTHLMTVLPDRDMHTTMLIEMRSLSAGRQAEVLAKRDAYEQYVESVIHEDQRAGRLRDDIATRYLTLALLNLLNWTIFWYTPDGDQSPTQIAAVLRSVFIDGARKA